MTFFKALALATLLGNWGIAAHADLQICNETTEVQDVSIGYKGDTEWTSEGWWKIDPGECSTPVAGDLKKRYYYLRAEVRGGDFRGEKYYFCTTPTEYTIVGDSDCVERGYARESFVEIDTGKTATSFTYTLTQDVAEAAQSPSTPGLVMCNETNHIQSVSIGYRGPEDWTSEGWWNIDPGACKTIISEPLVRNAYYYRAEVEGGEFDGQNFHFCTDSKEYTIVGDTECGARGFERESFYEILTNGRAGIEFTLVP